VRAVFFAVVVLASSFAEAGTSTFDLGHRRGSRHLRHLAPGATRAVLTARSRPFTADVQLGSVLVTEVGLVADRPMSAPDGGCADVDLVLYGRSGEGRLRSLGRGRVAGESVPGVGGRRRLRVELDSAAERTVRAGEALLLRVAVTNDCAASRRVRVSGRPHLTSIEPGADVVRCGDVASDAVQRYVARRRRAIETCEARRDRWTVAPRGCPRDDDTAAVLAAAEAEAVWAMRDACSDELVTRPQPDGLGAVACGGADGYCQFAVAGLDDAVRGNDNDYVDCMLCLAERAADSLLAEAEDVEGPDPSADLVRRCERRIGSAAVAFTRRKMALVRRCRALKAGGDCPDGSTAARVAAAQVKVAARLLAPCAEVRVARAAARAGSAAPPAPRPVRTAEPPGHDVTRRGPDASS
jgi:hypothetical protein